MFFTLDRVVIESGARLDGDGGGYSPAQGPGAGSGSQGGSYASLGGNANSRKYYGSLYSPHSAGSGGGSGAGGSWINVTAGGYVKVEGTMSVNGDAGSGAGSGGCLTISTSLLFGYGQLASHGGYGWYCVITTICFMINEYSKVKIYEDLRVVIP